MLIDAASALARAMSFIALFQAAGVTIFLVLFAARSGNAVPFVRKLGFISALAGILFVSAHYALEAARMAGALSGVFDPFLQRLVLESPMSAVAGVRIAGLVLIAVAIKRTGPWAMPVCLGGATLSLGAFLLVGHTAAHPDRIWLAPVLGVHLAVAAFWFGSLAPLYMVSRTEHASVAADIVERFSRIATWLVPAIFFAGLLMAWLLIDRWAVFGESYGLLLLAKVAGFAALMGLAALNKWRFGPALARTPGVAAAFQRSVAVEYVLVCAVLGATAVMTSFFSPSH